MPNVHETWGVAGAHHRRTPERSSPCGAGPPRGPPRAPPTACGSASQTGPCPPTATPLPHHTLILQLPTFNLIDTSGHIKLLVSHISAGRSNWAGCVCRACCEVLMTKRPWCRWARGEGSSEGGRRGRGAAPAADFGGEVLQHRGRHRGAVRGGGAAPQLVQRHYAARRRRLRARCAAPLGRVRPAIPLPAPAYLANDPKSTLLALVDPGKKKSTCTALRALPKHLGGWVFT